MTNTTNCILTLTVTGTTEVTADARCSCGWDTAYASPEVALSEWRAHSVRRSYARQFTNH